MTTTERSLPRRAFIKSLALAGTAAFGPNLFAREARSVAIDSDGMLNIKGKREFVLGLYSLPRVPEPMRAAREAGFDLVHLPAHREDFARAREHQLYGWTGLGSISPKNPAESEARIRKTVLSLKDEPALLFWETEDEPTFVWKKADARIQPEDIIATARFVRRLDPDHPLYLNHSPTNLVPTLQRYNPGADILATDIYPVIPRGIRELYALWPDGQQGDFLNPHISQVGQYADKMRQVAGPSRAVFMVLQAFAWEDLREKDRDPSFVLYPNRHQLRFMAYQSIVHGVNGLLYWGLASTPPEAPLWMDLCAVSRVLHELKEALAARKSAGPLRLEYHDTGHSLDRGIEWIIKPAGRGVLLLAVNADPNPVEVTFSGLKKYQRCEVLFESRLVNWSQGSFRDTFAPFDARVYRLHT